MPDVPVRVHPLPVAEDPLRILRRVTAPGEPALLLDACAGLGAPATPGPDRMDAWSFIAAHPRTCVVVEHGRAWRRERDGAWAAWPGVTDAFAAARALRREAPTLAPAPEGVPFPGGVAGLLSYDAGRALERLPSVAEDEHRVPDAFLARFDAVIAVHHPTGRAWIAAADTPEGEADARVLRARLAEPPRPLGRGDAPAPAPTLPRETFERMVADARDLVHAGDVFQVNLSHRLDAVTPPDLDPLATYARLRAANPAPMAGVLLTGPLPDGREVHILSSSPERLVSAEPSGTLETRPIAGTRPRGGTPDEDAHLARVLREDGKENAEHVMLVDLARNDLGRVAAFGSVRVPRLLAVESYARVHHLVSTVTARLAPGRDVVDATAALFPGGTITGAPKVRAMEIIDTLEPIRRGAYTGGLGYWSGTGSADWNILIRSLVHVVDSGPEGQRGQIRAEGQRGQKGRAEGQRGQKGRAEGQRGAGRLSLQVGAGVVWDSVPAREWDETLAKARGILDAFSSEEVTSPADRVA